MHVHEATQLLINFRDECLRQEQSDNIDDQFSFFAFCFRNLFGSRSQLLQDLFVLHQLKGKKHGFFVEFGGYTGVDLSNTFLLEKDYEWSGIVAEPDRSFRGALKQTRDCAVDFRCVWTASGEFVEFNAVSEGLSTLAQFSDCDQWAKQREGGTRYMVETVSLNDLLKQHYAPRRIDYISIDTEGSEYEISESVRLRFFRREDFHYRARLHVEARGYSRAYDSERIRTKT